MPLWLGTFLKRKNRPVMHPYFLKIAGDKRSGEVLFSINSGLLEACVLALLSSEDSYGYKLTQDAKVLMPISESTLYPVLKRLQSAGFLETYDMPMDGRNRKYYRITADGKRQQGLYRNEWESYKSLIENIFKGAQRV